MFHKIPKKQKHPKEKRMNKKHPKNIKDSRLVFSHRNLQRWSIFSTQEHLLERVLERRGPNGTVIDRCRIGNITINKIPYTLSTEHGKMWNLIEALHDIHRPQNGVLRIPTTDFYDFVVDIRSLNDPSRRKGRDSREYRDHVYRCLYVLTAVPMMHENWQEKDGSCGPQRFNLLDGFKMYGEFDGVRMKDAEHGIIEITINPIVAAGLRARHTSPVLVEVANSFKTPTAWALYRYLDKVLSKTFEFSIALIELANRLDMNERKDSLIKKVRSACEEIEGNDVTSGRVTVCKVEKREGGWWVVVKRGSRVNISTSKTSTFDNEKTHPEIKQIEERDAAIRRIYREEIISESEIGV